MVGFYSWETVLSSLEVYGTMNSLVNTIATTAQIEQHILRALDQLKEADDLARHDPYMKA